LTVTLWNQHSWRHSSGFNGALVVRGDCFVQVEVWAQLNQTGDSQRSIQCGCFGRSCDNLTTQYVQQHLVDSTQRSWRRGRGFNEQGPSTRTSPSSADARRSGISATHVEATPCPARRQAQTNSVNASNTTHGSRLCQYTDTSQRLSPSYMQRNHVLSNGYPRHTCNEITYSANLDYWQDGGAGCRRQTSSARRLFPLVWMGGTAMTQKQQYQHQDT
jgi:hypothetical protein